MPYLCLKVRSATANRKKNKNVKHSRSTKSMNKTVFCHPDLPNDNWNIRSHEKGVFSISKAGISKKFNSVDSDELIKACQPNENRLILNSSQFVDSEVPHTIGKMPAPTTGQY